MKYEVRITDESGKNRMSKYRLPRKKKKQLKGELEFLSILLKDPDQREDDHPLVFGFFLLAERRYAEVKHILNKK